MRSRTANSVLKLLRRPRPLAGMLALSAALCLSLPFVPAHADDTWTRGALTLNSSTDFGSISEAFRAASTQAENAASGSRLLVPDISQSGGVPTFTWTGGGTNSNWSNGANWANGIAPSNPQNSLHFGGTSNLNANNDFANASAGNQIFFDSGAGSFTLSGNAINFFDYGGVTPGFENNSSNLQTVTIQCDVENTSMNLVANTGDLTFSNNSFYLDNGTSLQASANTGKTITISDGINNGNQLSGTIMFGGTDDTSTGGGTIVLQGVNNYTGETDINSGTVRVDANETNSAYFVGNGGTTGTAASLLLGGGTNGQSGGVTFSPAITVNPGDGSDRTIGGTNTSGTNTFTGNIVLDGNYGDNHSVTVTAATGGTVAFSGIISGAGQAITKTGAGTVILMGADTYTGGTTVSQGVISGNAGSYGSGAVSVASGATVDYTQSGMGTATNNISGAGTASFGGNASPGANGSGGTINYTGQDSAAQTSVKSGTLLLNRSGGSALTGPVAVAMGATVQLGGDSQIATTTPGTANPAAVALNGGTLNANGHSDGTVSGTPSQTDPTASAVTSSMGALSLGGSGTTSTLDFGASQQGSGPFVLAFADSLNTLGGGRLNVIDYAGGTDALYIGTTNDLTPAQLGQITFNGFGVIQLSNGEVVAPEPGGSVGLMIGAAALGGLVAVRRRRSTAQPVAA